MPHRASLIQLVGLLCALALAGGCVGGSKILKEPIPLELDKPLATSEDSNLRAAVDWVIVPGGPGTWARKAGWDEYLISVQPSAPCPLDIQSIALVDGLETRQMPELGRRELVAATRATRKRFRKAGLKPVTSAGTGGLLAAGALAGGALIGAEIATLSSLGLGGSTVAAAGAQSGALVIGAPIIIVGGIMRGANHKRVDNEIIARQTKLPYRLAADEVTQLHVFMPITPSPQRVEIQYSCAETANTLPIDLSEHLAGLHLEPDEDS